LTLTPSRQGHPPVLDRARHSLPRNRRRHRQGPRENLRDQPLDPRRHERHPADRRGRGSAWSNPSTRVQEEDRQEIQPRFRRAEAVRIGAESYTPGSHEFLHRLRGEPGHASHLGCRPLSPHGGALRTKISSVMCFLPEIALHVSRGVRWDSDHVVTLTDDLQAIAQELSGAVTPTGSTSAWITSTPASTAWPPDHRHAQHAQGPAPGVADSDRHSAPRRSWPATTPAAWL